MQVCTWINVRSTRLLELMKWCLVRIMAGMYVTLCIMSYGPVIWLIYLCITGYDKRNMLFPHLSEHFTSYQAFCQYVRYIKECQQGFIIFIYLFLKLKWLYARKQTSLVKTVIDILNFFITLPVFWQRKIWPQIILNILIYFSTLLWLFW